MVWNKGDDDLIMVVEGAFYSLRSSCAYHTEGEPAYSLQPLFFLSSNANGEGAGGRRRPGRRRRRPVNSDNYPRILFFVRIFQDFWEMPPQSGCQFPLRAQHAPLEPITFLEYVQHVLSLMGHRRSTASPSA
ncbi:hypothetical protein EVAR_101165_1 [Eumeta japonica]|uniref:Uncharacterized protein n=1 Tax=Eumeta variegata TaxID=151549 RepID=A0A4C1SEK6_EUMVA|nr:hypothetical protein EVAR_101165_1 [Eumeta japonica]